MQALFSLDHPIRPFLTPADASLVTIRAGSRLRARMADGSNFPVVEADAGCTLKEACRLVLQAAAAEDGALPWLLAVENSQPAGLLAPSRLFSLIVHYAGNQTVLLETLLDTMSEATTIVDQTTRVLYWNKAAEKIYELPRKQVVGTSLDEHFASESIRLKDALAEGSKVERVYHVPRPDRHVLINSAPVTRDGAIIGAISIEQDITELVRLNEELADTTAHLRNLQQEMSRYQAADDPFYTIRGFSASIQAAIQAARKVAQTDATVLLYGESGVGKELFAQAIHQASRRGDKPFIAINCAAIPAALFESELFGYQGGAFTGAERKGKPGKLELAHGGTLFLDEVGELPLELQAKLLRALQERQFYRVGGTEPITVNTRIIAATNRPLEQMVAEGRFREDLYYRLNVFFLDIPPLRQRKEDIPELVQIFLQEYSSANGQPVPRMSTEVMNALLDYAWPGNVRELRNVMERLTILQEGGVIHPEHLPATIRSSADASRPAILFSPSSRQLHPPPPEALDSTSERERILAALNRTYGNKKAAAELLGVSRGTLYNKLKKYGITL